MLVDLLCATTTMGDVLKDLATLLASFSPSFLFFSFSPVYGRLPNLLFRLFRYVRNYIPGIVLRYVDYLKRKNLYNFP